MAIYSADSHMLVLDQAVLERLASKHHDAYLATKGPHRRAGITPADPGAGPAGEWDPKARLADMDLDGVDGEVLYTDPTGGASLYKLGRDEGLACFTAFNDAALEFAAVDPRRLAIVHLLPLHDIGDAIAELHRIVGDGARAVQLPLYPEDAGLPKYWDATYEPLWAAIAEAGTPISLHVCPPAGRGLGRDPTPARGIFQVMPPIFMSQALTELVLTGIFERHPALRVVLVESGLSWIPYLLDRLDRVSEKLDWPAQGMPSGRPSDYWYRNMAATFEEDQLGLEMRERIGVDNLLWATDYPHPDSTFPRSIPIIEAEFASCTPAETAAMTGGNVARLYGFATTPSL
ncbi:MAG TPA: amidohydrolase family protein [Acidimicrobiia bacterium]|nr:amidohydrolase family protein [Acidimicrobiia bacterium]